MEIGETLVYYCNTTNHNRRTDNFNLDNYTLDCLENNTFTAQNWPSCAATTYCPDPTTSFSYAAFVIPKWRQGDPRHYESKINFTCSDPRYLIKITGSYKSPVRELSVTCEWQEKYDINPETFECILTYCYNPDRSPFSNGQNVKKINGLIDSNFTLLNRKIEYECQNGKKLEMDTTHMNDADDKYIVRCGSDGEYIYPSSPPQCSSNIQCEDPGLNPFVQRKYVKFSKFRYKSEFKYSCIDPRQHLKLEGSSGPYKESIKNTCRWRKKYDFNGTLLACKIVQCAHPHNDPGNHTAPEPDNDLVLVDHPNWKVQFEEEISYVCNTGEFFEISEEDPTQNEIKLKCITDLGIYNVPAQWPNCTKTVRCGQPPRIPPESLPWNDTGSRQWLYGASQYQVYNLKEISLGFSLKELYHFMESFGLIL